MDRVGIYLCQFVIPTVSGLSKKHPTGETTPLGYASFNDKLQNSHFNKSASVCCVASGSYPPTVLETLTKALVTHATRQSTWGRGGKKDLRRPDQIVT
jgi:hypothetical protein